MEPEERWPPPWNLSRDFSLPLNGFERFNVGTTRLFRYHPDGNMHIICTRDAQGQVRVEHIAARKLDIGRYIFNKVDPAAREHHKFHIWNPRRDGVVWSGYNHFPYMTPEEEERENKT